MSQNEHFLHSGYSVLRYTAIKNATVTIFFCFFWLGSSEATLLVVMNSALKLPLAGSRLSRFHRGGTGQLWETGCRETGRIPEPGSDSPVSSSKAKSHVEKVRRSVLSAARSHASSFSGMETKESGKKKKREGVCEYRKVRRHCDKKVTHREIRILASF